MLNDYTGKFDKQSGVGKSLNIYEQKVYESIPDVNGVFVDSNGNVIAKRLLLDLKQGSVYKTQFYNKQLSNAIRPINNYTQIILYKDDVVVNNLTCLPELNTEYASVICKVLPRVIPNKVSVVIYCGPAVDDIILKDGSITMDADYVPSKSTDLVTKGYADDLIEDFTAASVPLKTFTLLQNEQEPKKLICFRDNQSYKTLYLRKYISHGAVEDCKIIVEPFAIPNDYSKDTKIGLVINGSRTNTARIVDIVNGASEYWTCTNRENIYNGDVDQFYWLMSLELKFNLKQAAEFVFDSDNPFINVSILIWDSGKSKSTSTQVFGVDEYISSPVEGNVSINYIKDVLQGYKTKYVSGTRYFPYDFEKIYNLTVVVSAQNNFLQYFRDVSNIKLQLLNSEKTLVKNYDLEITSHRPTDGTFEIQQEISFNIDVKYLQVQLYNNRAELLYSYSESFDTTTDSSDESNRCTTPSGLDITPTVGYGKTWNPEKDVETYDMIPINNVYHGDPKDSAVCFFVDPIDCYSHAKIDIDHDGKMYILSEGNTGWLNCQELYQPFNKPVGHNEGCLVNNNFYSFGKAVYNSRLFIRIINANIVKFNSVTLE